MHQKPLPTPFEAWIATVIAFLVTGMAELVWLAVSGRLVGEAPPDLGLLAAHLLSLTGVLGVMVGAIVAVLVPPMIAALRPGVWLRSHVSPAGSDATPPAALNRATAWGFAGILGLVIVGLLTAGASHVVLSVYPDGTASGYVGLAAGAAVVVAIAAMFPLAALITWVFNGIAPTGRLVGLPTPALPMLTICGVAVASAWRVAMFDLGAYRPESYVIVASAVALGLVLLSLLRGRALRVSGWTVLLLTVVVGGTIWTAAALSTAPLASRLIGDAHAGRVALTVTRAMTDLDGDGASALFAGGDCDEGNPAIGPTVTEVPGNGLDDDCQGGDAPIAAVMPNAVQPPAEPKVALEKTNIVVIVINALRPDRLGLYGHRRRTSPNIDAWAEGAWVFEQAYAASTHTPRALPALLTGRYPSRIAWTERDAAYSDLAPSNETLFEIFKASGWRTEAVSAHWYFERAAGLKDGVDLWDNRGFLTIKDSVKQSAASDITPRVVKRLETLRGSDEPFLLFVHYFEPRADYLTHPEVRTFGSRKKRRNRYDSEIAFVDHHLAPVFEALAHPDLAGDTLVVITSDHGEALGEHGVQGHGQRLHEPAVRVPLLIKAPGSTGRRIERAVSLVDLVPTLAGVVGLKATGALGQDLAPLLAGEEAPASTPLFLEQLPYPEHPDHLVGIVSGGLKAIRDLRSGEDALFDLPTDPAEAKNLLSRDPKTGTALFEQLGAFIADDPGR